MTIMNKYIRCSFFGVSALVLGVSLASAQNFSDSLKGASLPAGLNITVASGATPSVQFTGGGVVFNGTDQAFAPI